MAICEQCGKEHDGTFGSGRFCSRSCSNKWVALNQSDEAKARKVAKGRLNLKAGNGRNFTYEDRVKGARATHKIKKERRRLWLEKVLAGELSYDEVYHGGYSHLRKALIEFGYKEHKCECCGLTEWMGGPIPLELHHKDGDGENFALENLGILCPNCHTLTDNYGWKGASKSKK